ncbi:glycoprotein Xg-like [Dipodomys merriami]|uniref:glycoprotein Xg-like n=1 Tax=Dipodomys merriami TaxID=94247 RepID=UPI003855E5DB
MVELTCWTLEVYLISQPCKFQGGPALLLLLLATLLCGLGPGGRGQADFDLADALDDPGLYLQLPDPPRPRPRGQDGDVYLPPQCRPPPQPQPPPGTGGEDMEGGGPDVEVGDGEARMERPGCREPSVEARIYGPGFLVLPPPGSALAQVVSPIVSVVVVALVGATITYF